MSADAIVTRFGSGRGVRRLEDPALLRGQGRYTDDLAVEGLAHLAFVRATHAHGELRAVDVAAAREMPGVLAVYTGVDLQAAGVKPMPHGIPLPGPGGRKANSEPRWPLAVGRVRYVGEAIAAVVAESRDAARAAADAVLVDIDERPAVVDPRAALRPDAPRLCAALPDNIAAAMRHGDAAAADAAFAAASHIVSVEVVNQRLAPVTMEPRVIVARPEGGRLVVDLSNQMPTAVRDGLAAALGLAKDQVRVRVGDVGGGFGMKGGLYPEDIAVAHAARQLGRPVKWAAQRLEDFLSAAHGRDQLSRGEMALDAHGRVLAVRVKSLANVGAYGTTVGTLIPLAIGPAITTSIYDIRTIDLDLLAVLCNTAPTGAYRGAGRPEAIYLIERLFDAAARELRLDPAELRRRNLIRPEQMPYRTAMAQVYDSGDFERVMDQGLALADWAGFGARREASAARGRLRGRGLATFLEWTGAGVLDERCEVRVRADGVIEIISATMAMGQGIATSYAQLAVDVFGVPIERIRILQGDTDRANGFGSAGSRSLFTGGGAVQVTAARAVDRGRELAAEALEAPAADIEYREGRYTVAGTDLGIGLFELAGRQPETQFAVAASAQAQGPSWPNGCHVAEVEIDPATGAVEVVAYASVNDIGRIVNPVIVRGQIEGGAVQGIGQALCEQVVYDPDSGQLLTASFMDYAMPRADQFRDFKTVFDTSVPCRTNVLGAKGVGELGTIGATPAVVNAVIDALATGGLGIAGLGRDAERVQMPIAAEQVWRALVLRELPPPVLA